MTAPITLPFDVTDVPTTEARNLQHVMHMLIQRGQGLALLNGLSGTELRRIDGDIWSNEEIAPQDRLATALRFRCLIAVFGARRLQEMLLSNGFPLIAAATSIAARMRLNVRYGFNPSRFHAALANALETPTPRHEARSEIRLAA